MSTIEPAEQLALVLSTNGMQRSTARVLAAFLFTDEPSLTLGDVVELLGISAGSASTAIRSLRNVGLLEQTPAPGSRRDHFRMRERAWETLFTTQNEAVRGMREAAELGLKTIKPDSPARQRLEYMRGFYDYLFTEIPGLVDRWRSNPSDDH
ncbi:GbsR/MarR family transcriptional regulator [Microlunatus sp. GCM10028923]|uniref:GbsR/MarR family transcriptional regulator n=1 Tax=Microlunatus sp. GCM10028923 TaxID=3273400 RepID=UPI0036211746